MLDYDLFRSLSVNLRLPYLRSQMLDLIGVRCDSHVLSLEVSVGVLSPEEFLGKLALHFLEVTWLIIRRAVLILSCSIVISMAVHLCQEVSSFEI